MANVPENYRFGLVMPDDDVTIYDLLSQSNHPDSGLTDKVPNISLEAKDILKERTKPAFGAPSVRHRDAAFEKKLSDRQVRLASLFYILFIIIRATMMNWAPRR
jgi:hypothetical protein